MYISQLSQLKPSFRALYNQAELLLSAGKKIVVEITEKKNKRTTAQNNYYWKFCEELAKFLREHDIFHKYTVLGVEIKKPFTKDTVHEDLNKPIHGIETTTKMSIEEFCDYMEYLMMYWQELTGGAFQMSELPANYLADRGYTIIN